MLKSLLAGSIGYYAGRESNRVSLPDDLDSATVDELRSLLASTRQSLIDKQLELEALSDSSEYAISQLNNEITSLQAQIATLEDQVDLIDRIEFSRTNTYLGGVEAGLENFNGQLCMRGASLVSVPIMVHQIQPTAQNGQQTSYQAAPLNTYELRSVNAPTAINRQLTMAPHACIALTLENIVHPTVTETVEVNGTPYQNTRTLNRYVYLLVELDGTLDSTPLRDNFKVSISRPVLWPRPNVMMIPISVLESRISFAMFGAPSVPIAAGSYEFLGETRTVHTISGTFPSFLVGFKRASVIAFPESVETKPKASVLPDGRMQSESGPYPGYLLGATGGYRLTLDNLTLQPFANGTRATGLVHNHEVASLLGGFCNMYGRNFDNFY